jgi:hypothetical protein
MPMKVSFRGENTEKINPTNEKIKHATGVEYLK